MGVCRRVREPRLIVSSNLEQVWDTAAALNRTAEPSLQSLERQLATRPDYLTLLGPTFHFRCMIMFFITFIELF